MKKIEFIKEWDNTLANMKKALSADNTPFDKKAKIALDAVEVALDALAKLDMIVELKLELEAHTQGKKVITWNYSLAEGIDEEGNDICYLRRSKTEEDE